MRGESAAKHVTVEFEAMTLTDSTCGQSKIKRTLTAGAKGCEEGEDAGVKGRAEGEDVHGCSKDDVEKESTWRAATGVRSWEGRKKATHASLYPCVVP